MTLTPADLTNLLTCARARLQHLTPGDIVLVAAAIQHAEADLAEMTKSAPADAQAEAP